MTNAQYWRANVRLIAVLLAIWAFVSLGCSVLLIDFLNQVTIFGTPLGFWMAQQGSIYVFLALIGAYVWMMEWIDKAHGVDPTAPTEGAARDH